MARRNGFDRTERLLVLQFESPRVKVGTVGLLTSRKRVNKATNLVDPASSHMLVSKIKPCMSKCNY